MTDSGDEQANDDRRRGQEMMRAVYGWDVSQINDDFLSLTVDHLFGRIWSRDVLSVRERRLMLIGLLIGTGQDDVVELQVEAALRLGEMQPAELREIVIFLSHYAGWPRGAKLNSTVENLIARHERPPPDRS